MSRGLTILIFALLSGLFAMVLLTEDLTLEQKLHKIDELRSKGPADVATVEKMGQELLDQYKVANNQAQIYFQMAHVLAQSNILTNCKKVAKYASLRT